jgi:hypothetical protein
MLPIGYKVLNTTPPAAILDDAAVTRHCPDCVVVAGV